MEFLFPLAFLLLPLPFILRRLSKPLPLAPHGALRVPFFKRLLGGNRVGSAVSISHPWRQVLASLIWLMLITAFARPVFVGDQIPLPAVGRNLMMAIDLSGSMDREDFTVDGRSTNRLSVVKAAADDFIRRRAGDRVGLVLFSDRAYLQAPLTLDGTVVRNLLDEAQVGLTGTQTAIGDAIAIAVKRLKDEPASSRVLILLTDGASNTGAIEPLPAAELARELGIRIYTIGVGAERMAVRTPFGRQVVNPSEDLDESTLKQIADLTGGQYFRAQDVRGLSKIYAELDKLEPVSGEPLYIRPSISLYFWPLGVALALAGLLSLSLILPGTLRRRSGDPLLAGQ
ncbi:MAG: VWA domain-containing protein [Lysobacterales bacterium]